MPRSAAADRKPRSIATIWRGERPVLAEPRCRLDDHRDSPGTRRSARSTERSPGGPIELATRSMSLFENALKRRSVSAKGLDRCSKSSCSTPRGRRLEPRAADDLNRREGRPRAVVTEGVRVPRLSRRAGPPPHIQGLSQRDRPSSWRALTGSGFIPWEPFSHPIQNVPSTITDPVTRRTPRRFNACAMRNAFSDWKSGSPAPWTTRSPLRSRCDGSIVPRATKRVVNL